MDNNNFYNWEEPGKDENTQPDNVPVETGKPIYTERVKKKGHALKYISFALVGAVLGSLLSTGILLGFGKTHPGGQPQVSYYSNEAADENNASTISNKGRTKLADEDVAEKVGPAVVGIINSANFFQQDVEQGSGSGIIINADGYIVTNNHVIENASSLKVILNNSEEYAAKVIGTDPQTDLAVLKIEAGKELPYATFGASADLKAGETAIAIGNPLGTEFAGTVTKGVISALNRSVTVEGKQLTLIQTDAAINPGNSGGALVNSYGEVIGINTVKISSGDVEGLGFAIPINEAKPIIQDLMEDGYVKGRPVIGLSGREMTQEMARTYGYVTGVYVVEVTPFSGAERAGIKSGDVITKVEDQEVKTVEDINNIRDSHQVGDKLKFEIDRRGQKLTVEVELGEDKPTTSQ